MGAEEGGGRGKEMAASRSSLSSDSGSTRSTLTRKGVGDKKIERCCPDRKNEGSINRRKRTRKSNFIEREDSKMKVKKVMMGLVVAVCLIAFQGIVAAQDKIELRQDIGIKEALMQFSGKRVSVTLDSGTAYEGILTKVGDHLVHISSLTGKEYFDAMIRIEKISALVVRAKSDR